MAAETNLELMEVHVNRSESLMAERQAERVYWDKVFERLAEADGHDRRSVIGQAGNPSIHIEELKKRVEKLDAKEVGEPILKLNGRIHE